MTEAEMAATVMAAMEAVSKKASRKQWAASNKQWAARIPEWRHDNGSQSFDLFRQHTSPSCIQIDGSHPAELAEHSQ